MVKNIKFWNWRAYSFMNPAVGELDELSLAIRLFSLPSLPPLIIDNNNKHSLRPSTLLSCKSLLLPGDFNVAKYRLLNPQLRSFDDSSAELHYILDGNREGLKYDKRETDKETELQLFVYDENDVVEFQEVSVENFFRNKSNTQNNWLNIHGLTNVDLIKNLTEGLNLNSLIVSDIVNISRGTSGYCLFDSTKSVCSNQRSNYFTLDY